MSVLDVVLWVLAGLLLVPLAVLVVECLAALLPPRRGTLADGGDRPRCAVLIPAHNEEGMIAATLSALLPQVRAGDRVVVVADNCTDATADRAKGLGVTVVERQDATRRGKGYALDRGVRHLREEDSPPEVVVIVDADCVVQDGSLDRLVREAVATGRPVQAAYTLDAPPDAGPKGQVSAFAFRFKNVIRPRGLDRLGLPCLLTGTGMAFPWPLLRDATLAHGNIVEDMQLGLDLAAAGRPPRFCPQAWVTGELPSGSKAAITQRTRWEHGHVQTILTQVPRLLLAALRRGRLDLVGLALELSVPPLSMLFLLWAVGLLAAAGAWWWAGAAPLPAALLAGGGLAVVLAILATWARFGRDRLPLRALLTVPFYVLWKVPIYLTLPFRRQKAWIRTQRPNAPPEEGPQAG